MSRSRAYRCCCTGSADGLELLWDESATRLRSGAVVARREAVTPGRGDAQGSRTGTSGCWRVASGARPAIGLAEREVDGTEGRKDESAAGQSRYGTEEPRGAARERTQARWVRGHCASEAREGISERAATRAQARLDLSPLLFIPDSIARASGARAAQTVSPSGAPRIFAPFSARTRFSPRLGGPASPTSRADAPAAAASPRRLCQQQLRPTAGCCGQFNVPHYAC